MSGDEQVSAIERPLWQGPCFLCGKQGVGGHRGMLVRAGVFGDLSLCHFVLFAASGCVCECVVLYAEIRCPGLLFRRKRKSKSNSKTQTTQERRIRRPIRRGSTINNNGNNISGAARPGGSPSGTCSSGWSWRSWSVLGRWPRSARSAWGR